mmetsp:Transcript_28059/g.94510  ORF Transcript_28059/g.94510 Transcript_28059/m.94510 type:complete len:210 (-) Transcript_28059:711-1340(-)
MPRRASSPRSSRIVSRSSVCSSSNASTSPEAPKSIVVMGSMSGRCAPENAGESRGAVRPKARGLKSRSSTAKYSDAVTTRFPARRDELPWRPSPMLRRDSRGRSRRRSGSGLPEPGVLTETSSRWPGAVAARVGAGSGFASRSSAKACLDMRFGSFGQGGPRLAMVASTAGPWSEAILDCEAWLKAPRWSLRKAGLGSRAATPAWGTNS